MRENNYYDAYYDDYNLVRVYMSKMSYGGESSYFYISDEVNNNYACTLVSKEDTNKDFNIYILSIDRALSFEHEYEVINEHGRRTILQFSGIVKTKRFDQEFFYNGDDLGCTINNKGTHFALWSPFAFRVLIQISKNKTKTIHEMQRSDKGVFRFSSSDNLNEATYVYLIRVHGSWKQTSDPYAYASSENSTASGVVDLKLIQHQDYDLPIMNSVCDAIIYEASIRDLTMQEDIGVKHPGTYVGFCEENATTKNKETGFSYIKSLNITHVQLMPVFDFGSVDEMNPFKNYNWGYDPNHFRCLEGSYSLNPCKPIERMKEFASLVDKCHQHGIRVNVDVVMNHVFDKFYNALECCVPNYFFQMNQEGYFSNGSFCGNDYDSNTLMGRKYIVDTCVELLKIYHIDGLRFDLMGILDVETMNQVQAKCQKLNKDFMVYGEGWNMPSYLSEDQRASINNQAKMANIAHFSDRFRDVIKGKTGNEDTAIKGYASGDVSLIEECKNVLCASCFEFGSSLLFNNPINCINYVECHDNMSVYDKISECCSEEDEMIWVRRQLMMNACTLLAQGIPFIHSGQEFGRTKQGLSNTYNVSDQINMIDYERKKHFNWLKEQSIVLINIRKHYRGFRYMSKSEMEGHVYFDDIDQKVLIYRIQENRQEIYVFFNPSHEDFNYKFDSQVELIFFNELKPTKLVSEVNVGKVSTIICIRNN